MAWPIQESNSFRQVFVQGIGLYTSFTGLTDPSFLVDLDVSAIDVSAIGEPRHTMAYTLINLIRRNQKKMPTWQKLGKTNLLYCVRRLPSGWFWYRDASINCPEWASHEYTNFSNFREFYKCRHFRSLDSRWFIHIKPSSSKRRLKFGILKAFYTTSSSISCWIRK